MAVALGVSNKKEVAVMLVTLAIRSGVRGCVFEVFSCSHGGKIKDGGNGSGSVPHQLLSTSMTFWKVCHHVLTEVILCPSNLQAPAWHFESLERYVIIYGCPGTTQTARDPNISLYLHIYITIFSIFQSTKILLRWVHVWLIWYSCLLCGAAAE